MSTTSRGQLSMMMMSVMTAQDVCLLQADGNPDLLAGVGETVDNFL